MRRTHTLGSLRSACGAFFWSRPEGIYNTIDIRRANGVSLSKKAFCLRDVRRFSDLVDDAQFHGVQPVPPLELR